VRIAPGGKTYGGATFSRGALYHLLRNEVYIGRIIHGRTSYAGQHRPIISTKLWRRVAARLMANHQGQRKGSSPPAGSLLSGILFDNAGIRFTPTHSLKSGKRYRYYTSQSVIRGTEARPQICRFPAHPFEQLIRSQVHRLLRKQTPCTAGLRHGPEAELIQEKARVLAEQWTTLTTVERDELLRTILKRVVVGPSSFSVEIDRSKLLGKLLGHRSTLQLPASALVLRIDGNFPVQRRGRDLQNIIPGQELTGTAVVPSVARAVAHARDWYQRIISGEVRTIKQISKQSGLSRTYIKKVMRCVNLSPKLADALLTGKQGHRNLQMLVRNVPLSWAEQERALLKAARF
jgi:site-specific DNA recombinase